MDTLTPPALLLLVPWIKVQKRNRTKVNFRYGGEETQNTDDQDVKARE